ncbi:MAG: sulfotransferase [Candidatus Marinimicrobia bacterium]|nr:sulfotransferase [Candidatus Neomarinimicrobiota bacterium]
MRLLEDFIKRYTINPIYRYLGRRKEKKHFTGDPIVILAAPRSGTTLLLSILDAYPNIYSIPEQTYGLARWREKKGKMIPDRIDRIYREMLRHEIPVAKNRWCEKTPRHIKHIKNILDYFPKAKAIHIVRDGRDVITSKHPKHHPDDYWVSVNRWVTDVGIGLEYLDHPRVLTLKYEDLVFHFDREIKRISNFLEEDFVPSKDEWTQLTSLKNSKHWKEPVQNLYSKSIGRWKQPEHRARIEEFMKEPQALELMQKLNYFDEDANV